MEEDDGDFWYCYFCVMKLHWKPSEYAFLPPHEKSVVRAFIDKMLETQKEQGRRTGKSSNRPKTLNHK